MVKYNNDGKELWHAISDSTGYYNSYYYKISFDLDSKRNVYISTTYQNSLCVLKYDAKGDQQWVRKFDNSTKYSFSRGLGIEIDNFDNVYASGFARVFGNIEPYIIIKYNPNGDILWSNSFHIFNDLEFDEGAFIGLDKSKNVYVAGNHVNNNSIIKFSIMKYSQTIGISQINSEVSEDYLLYQNYPNPFNPKTIINFQLPKSGKVSLKVYNAVGKEVITLINENKNSGNYNINFDGSNFPSGIYFYTLKSGSFKESKRMLLLK